MAMLTRTTSEAEDLVKTMTKKTMRTKISQVNKHSHSFPRVYNPLLESAVFFLSAFVGFFMLVMGAGSNYNARNAIGGLQPISTDTDNNAAIYNCWWTNKRSLLDIFCFRPPTWRL